MFALSCCFRRKISFFSNTIKEKEFANTLISPAKAVGFAVLFAFHLKITSFQVQVNKENFPKPFFATTRIETVQKNYPTFFFWYQWSICLTSKTN